MIWIMTSRQDDSRKPSLFVGRALAMLEEEMQQIGQQEGQAACMSELQGLLERECQPQVASCLFTAFRFT